MAAEARSGAAGARLFAGAECGLFVTELGHAPVEWRPVLLDGGEQPVRALLQVGDDLVVCTKSDILRGSLRAEALQFEPGFSDLSRIGESLLVDPNIAERPLKRECTGLSMSNTPSSMSPDVIGTTISALDAVSQTMWSGNSCTFGTSTVSRRWAAVPHTPLPSGMRVHAGLP